MSNLTPEERAKNRTAKMKMSRAQREHEKFLAIIELFRESPEALAWAVLIGGTAATALLAQYAKWQAGDKSEGAELPPGVKPDGSIDWMKLLQNVGVRAAIGPISAIVLPADQDVTQMSWSGLTASMVAGGLTGVAAAYLILSAMSGGARENGASKGALGGLLNAMGGLGVP